MRKVSFGIALGFVLVACGGGGEESQPPKMAEPVATAPAPTEMASSEAPKEEPKKASFEEMQANVLRGIPDALNAHDAKKVAGFYTENAVVRMPGETDVKGRAAIEADIQKMFDAFKDFKEAASRVFVKGDVAVVEWTFTGTQTGDLGPMKATEKPVGAQGIDVVWFDKDSGLIKEQHSYMDLGTIFSQAGFSKHKARAIPTLPSGEPKVLKSAGTPDEQKALDAVKAMTAALEAKKEADFLATIADDVEYDDMTMPQTMKGKADAKKFFKQMTTAFPDAKFQVLNQWAFGDFVVTEGQMTGTNKGSFFGMPATKKPLTLKSLAVHQFKDGKLVHGWSYANGVDMLDQLGLLPKKPAAAKAAEKKPADDKKPAEKK